MWVLLHDLVQLLDLEARFRQGVLKQLQDRLLVVGSKREPCLSQPCDVLDQRVDSVVRRVNAFLKHDVCEDCFAKRVFGHQDCQSCFCSSFW